MSDILQRHSDGQMVSHLEPLRCVAVNFFLLAQTHFFCYYTMMATLPTVPFILGSIFA